MRILRARVVNSSSAKPWLSESLSGMFRILFITFKRVKIIIVKIIDQTTTVYVADIAELCASYIQLGRILHSLLGHREAPKKIPRAKCFKRYVTK